MNDEEANKVVFVIIIFIILGILFILTIFAKAYILNKILNNSGNYNAIKILLMFAAAISIFFLIYWLVSFNTFKYNSLVRGKEENSQKPTDMPLV